MPVSLKQGNGLYDENMKTAFFMVSLLNHGRGAEKYFIEIGNEIKKGV